MTRTDTIPLVTVHDELEGEKQRFVRPDEARAYVEKRREQVAKVDGQRNARKIVLEDEPDAAVYKATIRRYTSEDDHPYGFYATSEALDDDVPRRHRSLYVGAWKEYAGGDASNVDGVTVEVAVLDFGANMVLVPAEELPRPVGEDYTPLNMHAYTS